VPEETGDALIDLFQSVAHERYIDKLLGNKPTPSCKVYSAWEVFKYNFLFWCTGFIVGLNFTHTDIKPLARLTLDPKVMKTWGMGMWAIFLFLMVLLLLIMTNLGLHYYKMNLIPRYIAWGALLTSAIVWNSKRQPTKELHIHHYALAMILMSFIQLQNPLITNIHGFFHGMFIEGACRWGFDPLWEPSEPENDVSREE